MVKWLRSAANQQQLDGFTVRRRGDVPTNIRVLLYLDQHPEQFKIHPQLGMMCFGSLSSLIDVCDR